MGLQLIAQADSEEMVAKSLADTSDVSEIFQIEGALWGISIPTKVVDAIGEEEIRRRLSLLNVYDLYEGKWKYA